jgi:hypothetical protein
MKQLEKELWLLCQAITLFKIDDSDSSRLWLWYVQDSDAARMDGLSGIVVQVCVFIEARLVTVMRLIS